MADRSLKCFDAGLYHLIYMMRIYNVLLCICVCVCVCVYIWLCVFGQSSFFCVVLLRELYCCEIAMARI